MYSIGSIPSGTVASHSSSSSGCTQIDRGPLPSWSLVSTKKNLSCSLLYCGTQPGGRGLFSCSMSLSCGRGVEDDEVVLAPLCCSGGAPVPAAVVVKSWHDITCYRQSIGTVQAMNQASDDGALTSSGRRA